MRSNSLFRALRVDKLIYAALESTLLAYVKRDYGAVPALAMMQLQKDEVTSRAEKLITNLRQARRESMLAELIDGESLIGGGSAPSAILPTTLIALTSENLTANELASRLRADVPPVIARVEDGRVLLDLRTVFPAQDEVLVRILGGITA
jgi:L-seryl-tRNA(Ser) seleniumtransferase